MRPLQALILISLLIALAGCGYAERKKEMALESMLSQYRTAMRWGHWDTVKGMRAPKAPAVPDLDLGNIRVTGYEILQPPLTVEEGRVLQVVEISYVQQDSQRLRTLQDRQEWRHDADNKKWQLFSPFPAFR